jgi:hypothetical protein
MALFGSKKKTEKKPHPASAPLPSGAQKVAEVLSKGDLSVRDIIAPSYVEVDFNHIKVDTKFYRTLFVVGYPRYVSANWLQSLITYDHPLTISMFIYPSESKEILNELKRKIGEMQATVEADMKSGKVVDPTVQVRLTTLFLSGRACKRG